ncbi:MAG TPA: TetR/AcrR family transcriptional regulator [Phototrophicaceae bacterium]|nr:TetR/AcrR family transcriptional regulator [Phototrophicaceae bacterium]
MARTVKPENYAAKRNEILDAALRLVYSKGYERMTIQDILNDLGMSSGAFYHYFGSKPAVLEALIERGQPEVEALLATIVADPNLSAPEKLRQCFDTLDRLRAEQQFMIAGLLHVWFADDNAIVREKSDAVIVERRAPLLNAIVRQGVAEGVFTTPYPDQAGIVIMAILRGTSTALLKLMIAVEPAPEREDYVAAIVATANASSEAIERMLGAVTPFLARADAGAVRSWIDSLRANTQARTALAADAPVRPDDRRQHSAVQ